MRFQADAKSRAAEARSLEAHGKDEARKRTDHKSNHI